RSPAFFHTQYRQIPWLRELHPDPIVRIHPETAADYGVKEGAWVYIESPRGRCKQKALVTFGMRRGIVLADHGWWLPEKQDPEHGCWDANINVLTDNEKGWDPGLGCTPGRSLLCKIYKVEE
ncbi:molybdopterin dinucleotide binding domain-containing protein, partial [Chloroflexota bacterium]